MTTATPRPMGVRDVLRIPSYRNIFAGQAISDIGDGITLLLLLLVINDLTGSMAALALMAIAEAVPHFTVGLVAGVYVDRWNRRTVCSPRICCAPCVVLSFACAASAEIVRCSYVLAFAQSSIVTFFRPARGALLPRIVPAAVCRRRTRWPRRRRSSARSIGAGIAGLMFGIVRHGVAGFAIDARHVPRSPSAFVCAHRRGGSGRIATGGAHGERRGRAAARCARASAIVRGSRALSGSLIAAAVSMLGLGAVNVLFVPLIVNDLSVDPPTWMAGIEAAQTAADDPRRRRGRRSSPAASRRPRSSRGPRGHRRAHRPDGRRGRRCGRSSPALRRSAGW